MRKVSLICATAALSMLMASPLFAMDKNTIVNTPVKVVDGNGKTVAKAHVDVTDSSDNVQVHAVRLKGKSNLKWKVINTVDSSHPATAKVQVRVGKAKSTEMDCSDVALMDSNGNQIKDVTFTLDLDKKSCQTSTN